MALPEPTTEAGAAGLRAILDQPRRALLAFDFDGVLAPIVLDPAQSRVHPDAVPALNRLAPLVGSMSIITSRTAAEVVNLGTFRELIDRSQLTVFGLYGSQRWDVAAGQVVSAPVGPEIDAARAELPKVLAAAGVEPGVRIEDKGGALVVHTRPAAEPDKTLDKLLQPLTDLATRHGLTMQTGRMVLELRAPGPDKGDTLTDNVRSCGAAAVAYIGDDHNDLAAFGAIDVLRADHGIAGLKICSKSAEVPELVPHADLVVDGPDGVAAFLNALAETLTNCLSIRRS